MERWSLSTTGSGGEEATDAKREGLILRLKSTALLE
jgi:hypothetical protein